MADKTHEQQRKFALDVMHELQWAYDDALVCFYVESNEHQSNFKYKQLVERLTTLKRLLEAHKDD